MSLSSSHHDLFHQPSTAEKISFVRSLMETGDLNADVAMALLKSIHSELAQPQGKNHSPYASYARMMASLQHKMPDVHQHVVTNWQAPQRADVPAEDESAEEGPIEAETSGEAKRTETFETEEMGQGEKFWEAEAEAEIGEPETEEHEKGSEGGEKEESETEEESKDEEREDEKREQEEEAEEKDREQEQEAEPEEEDQEENENETEEEPMEEPGFEESTEEPEEPKASEQSHTPEGYEEEVEESEKPEVEVSKEAEGIEGTEAAEEGERMATEAAEAAAHMEHAESEAEIVEEEEPPMEATE